VFYSFATRRDVPASRMTVASAALFALFNAFLLWGETNSESWCH
jgi:hypothetical protein